VDANRGILYFEDLLKRPFESWKYLLGVVEDGATSLDVGTVEVDTVFLATSNDVFLAAFKEVPEFQSFKGRMELIRTPYLLDYRVEKAIYDEHLDGGLAAGVGRHVAPHVTWTLAFWAVLSRLHRPKPDHYQGRLAELLARLGPMEKALLYADQPLDNLSHDELKELRAETENIARETENEENYEGRIGASPREMKLLLMNAAQSPDFRCVSPFAVLKGLETLVEAHSVYEFLRQTPSPGGYHEHAAFVTQVRAELLRRIADEVRISMGLVDERRYIERFERYITHVSYWLKHEKIPNPITHLDETPDEEFMADVERIIGVVSSGSKVTEFRNEVITRIGAWSLDNRGQRPDYERIFPRPITDLRESFFSERKRQVNQISNDLLIFLVDGPQKLEASDLGLVQTTLDTLKTRFGYCDHCAKDAVLALLRKG
jgi:predicted Ser/Thr protein kinase